MAKTNEFTQDTIAEITAKATTDSAFRQALVKNPSQTLAQHGFAKAAEARVRFIERPVDADLVVVLPDFSTADAELSANELEAVAGGTDDFGCTVCGDQGKTLIICGKTCLGTFS